MYYYKVFGLTVGSPLDFTWPLELVRLPTAISCKILQASDSVMEEEWDLFYTGPLNPNTSQPKIKIFSSSRGILLSYPGRSSFEILPDKIAYDICHKFEQQLFETSLFQVAFVLWLELIGMSVLHASAVVVKNSSFGFLANGATGKSTLAAAFVRSGARFLTDDIFPIEAQLHGYCARPSYAWLRLLPETARALGCNTERNKGIYQEKFAVRLDESFGKFCPDPVPLAALYLPVRSEDVSAVSIETLSSKQAYLGLLQHTFLGKWLVKSPWHARRLEFFAKLVKDIPIKRLTYPSGYEHLPVVVDAVNRDLDL